ADRCMDEQSERTCRTAEFRYQGFDVTPLVSIRIWPSRRSERRGLLIVRAAAATKRYGRAAAGIGPRSFAMARLRAAAVAPPFIKTTLFHRLCAAFARQHVGDAKLLIRTNLGISVGMRCYIPLGKFSHVFGRPEHNVAERSTLALAALLSKECAHF